MSVLFKVLNQKETNSAFNGHLTSTTVLAFHQSL